jgi:hypothetical protein
MKREPEEAHGERVRPAPGDRASDVAVTSAPTAAVRPALAPEPVIESSRPVEVRIGKLEIRAPEPPPAAPDPPAVREPAPDFAAYAGLRGGALWRGYR